MKLQFSTILVLLLFAALGAAQQTTSASAMLPSTFAGWHASRSQASKDPALVDAANAAVLNEYGLTDAASGTYTRDDGRKLTLKAARFQDASGAYGAFTFYRTPHMQKEEIGDLGASLGPRVLFFRGKVLVDAAFDRLSGMSAAELRELAQNLPATSGTDAKLPDLPGYLPKKSLLVETSKYVMGPLALESLGVPLNASQIDFRKGAEVVTAKYSIAGTDGTLMLVAYPTAQIAASKLQELEAALQAHQLSDPQLALRRTGRIVVLAAGLPEESAKSLATDVNYDSDVTWNQNTYHNPKDNVGRVVLGGILLSAVLIGLLLVSSVAFGSLRVAMKRFLPGRFFDRPEQVEIIALHLADPIPDNGKSGVSRSINAG